MKDRQTRRVVKNILHNELGVTSEKVELLITDYINKKFDDKVQRFLDSSRFEYLLNKRIDEQIKPIVRENLRNQLSGININVSLNNKDSH